MGSRGWAALLRGMLLLIAGGTFALAVQAGLYATALVAGLAALWGIATGVGAARRPVLVPVAAPLSAPDPAFRERRLTALLDLSPAPIVTLDGEGRLQAINRAARRLFGAADLIAAPPAGLIEAILVDQPGASATVMIDGRSYALASSDFVLGGAASRMAALIDIDAELKVAEAATLRDLVQVLSHEIVNALTPIASLSRTAAEMLAEDASADPAVREAVATVARRAEGLQRFGQGYRSLARLPAPSVRRIDAHQLLADLARLFATRWPVIALSAESRGVAHLDADPDQLSGALWALLQNAAEAIERQPQGRCELHIDGTAPTIRFRISDNGPGIASQDRAAVFRPFFTTKRDGTGVGLALARQIFLAHGGDLVLVDAAQGATFEGRLHQQER